jgi:hypothetical protein
MSVASSVAELIQNITGLNDTITSSNTTDVKIYSTISNSVYAPEDNYLINIETPFVLGIFEYSIISICVVIFIAFMVCYCIYNKIRIKLEEEKRRESLKEDNSFKRRRTGIFSTPINMAFDIDKQSNESKFSTVSQMNIGKTSTGKAEAIIFETENDKELESKKSDKNYDSNKEKISIKSKNSEKTSNKNTEYIPLEINHKINDVSSSLVLTDNDLSVAASERNLISSDKKEINTERGTGGFTMTSALPPDKISDKSKSDSDTDFNNTENDSPEKIGNSAVSILSKYGHEVDESLKRKDFAIEDCFSFEGIKADDNRRDKVVKGIKFKKKKKVEADSKLEVLSKGSIKNQSTLKSQSQSLHSQKSLKSSGKKDFEAIEEKEMTMEEFSDFKNDDLFKDNML